MLWSDIIQVLKCITKENQGQTRIETGPDSHRVVALFRLPYLAGALDRHSRNSIWNFCVFEYPHLHCNSWCYMLQCWRYHMRSKQWSEPLSHCLQLVHPAGTSEAAVHAQGGGDRDVSRRSSHVEQADSGGILLRPPSHQACFLGGSDWTYDEKIPISHIEHNILLFYFNAI